MYVEIVSSFRLKSNSFNVGYSLSFQMGFNLVQSAERESSEDRTTPLELFSEELPYDYIVMFVKNFILSKLSAYVLLSTSISKVPLLSFFNRDGFDYSGNDLMDNKLVDFSEVFNF